QHVAIGVVVVGIDFGSTAVGQSHDGAQSIEEVVVLVPVRCALVVQEPTTTAHVMRLVATTVLLLAQAQSTVVVGRRVDRHPVALIRPTVDVGITANVLGLVLTIIGQ